MKNSKRNYPIAIILVAFFAIVCGILGSLSIAMVIPKSDINMSIGVIQAFKVLLNHYNLVWLIKLMALLLAIGALAEVTSWIVGPSESLIIAIKEGYMPKFLAKENKRKVPTRLLYFQAFIVSLWALVITIGGQGSNSSFLIAMTLAVLIYLSMYIVLYLSYFKLLFTKKMLKEVLKFLLECLEEF